MTRASRPPGGVPAGPTALRGRSSTEVIAVLLEDRNLDAILHFLGARVGAEAGVGSVTRWDLRAAIVEVLGWEGIHA